MHTGLKSHRGRKRRETERVAAAEYISMKASAVLSLVGGIFTLKQQLMTQNV